VGIAHVLRLEERVRALESALKTRERTT
jgi:hypothetical protein